MNAELVGQLLDRALARVESQQTDMAESTRALAASVYIDPERAEQDARIVRQTPVIVAHHTEVAQPGDYVTCEVGGVPVVVLRDRRGTLRAFVNACRHRGAKLVSLRRGRKLKQLVCPYHAWSYACDGTLTKIPCAEAFADGQRRDLQALPLFERFGYVFVRADGVHDAATETWLDPLAELDGFGLAGHAQVLPYERRVAANWKLVVDTGLEAYHVRSTHRTTIYKTIFFDNCSLVDRLGPHLRIVFPKTNIERLRERPRAQWNLRDVAYVGYLLFPNTTLLVTPDHVIRMTVVPDGATACRVQLSMLTSTFPASERDWAVAQHNSDLMARTFDEDFAMAESIASGLHRGTQRQLVLGRMELGLQHFHATLEAMC